MKLKQASLDYQRIAQALAYLRVHYRDQPSLADAAAHCGLSESHFQRVFSRWAGISPKRFVQHLTVEHAKQTLAEQTSLLDVAAQTGLSGPGRLHDLFVDLEAMSPGEYRRSAAGMEIGWSVVPTPFGEASLAFTERGICYLAFLNQDEPLQLLTAQWPQARLVRAPSEAEILAERIFSRAKRDQPVSAWVVGTNFQVKVWRALLAIPVGRIESYQGVATNIAQAKAARAVGSAIARNPIGYLIPCHRVLRQNGEIGEYHWGSERKAAMVAWEAAQCLAPEDKGPSEE